MIPLHINTGLPYSFPFPHYTLLYYRAYPFSQVARNIGLPAWNDRLFPPMVRRYLSPYASISVDWLAGRIGWNFGLAKENDSECVLVLLDGDGDVSSETGTPEPEASCIKSTLLCPLFRTKLSDSEGLNCNNTCLSLFPVAHYYH